MGYRERETLIDKEMRYSECVYERKKVRERERDRKTDRQRRERKKRVSEKR
jgi:hypothetical protein